MAIRVQCQCGQSLSVPDDKAGKSGKCPKCGELIRIPQASAANALASAAKATTAAKSPTPKASRPANVPAKAATVPTSDEPSLRPNSQNIKALLEEVGLAKRVGSFCPNCDKPFAQGAVFCIKCGLNFATGEKSNQYELESTRLEFDNMHLNEAAEMMKRDQALASRMLNAGVPWWVILCVLLSGLLIVATGCLLVEAAQGGARPTDTPIGRLQAYPAKWIWLGLLACNCVLVSVFAHMATTGHAFRESRTKGLMCLFVPGFSPIFGMMRIKQIRGTVISYWVAMVVGIPLIIYIAAMAPPI